MDSEEKLQTILEALGEQAPVILIHSGIAWEGHLSRLSRNMLTGVVRMQGSYAERIVRDFTLDDLDDIAIVKASEAPLAEEQDEDDLNKLSRELIARADRAHDPAVERALRRAQASVMDAEMALKRTKGPSSVGGPAAHPGDRSGTSVGQWNRNPNGTFAWLE